MIESSDYYRDANVRARLIEFLGGESIEQATSVYITPNGHAVPEWYNPKPVNDLWRYCEEGCEIGRSLWDRKAVIAHLDIEYELPHLASTSNLPRVFAWHPNCSVVTRYAK
jgi:hypothetical protein